MIRGEIKGVFLRCIKKQDSDHFGKRRFEETYFRSDRFRSEPLSKASSSKLPIFKMLNYEVISYERANFRSDPLRDRFREVTDFRSNP